MPAYLTLTGRDALCYVWLLNTKSLSFTKAGTDNALSTQV